MFKNLTMSNDFGPMKVVTTGVVTQKMFMTIVFNGNEAFDMQLSQDREQAEMVHARFCEMCSIFAPLQEKVNSEDEAVKQEGLRELADLELHTQARRSGQVH